MKNARKYNLIINQEISCGIGTKVFDSSNCNLLNTFTITADTTPPTTCIYPTITIDDLKTLSTIDYQKRVIDFLDYVQIESDIVKESLFNESSISEPLCEPYFCQLNPDFLVYKFLSGIRIINIGDVNGVAQYKVYPSTGNSNNFTWQTNPTFLNLNQNEIYVVEVRDYYNGIEVCKNSKTISMILLSPSTTGTLAIKTISLKLLSGGAYGCGCYKAGCINIVPELSCGEKVQLDYIVNTNVIGSGSGSVIFFCKAYQCNLTCKIQCYTNTNGISPRNGSLLICYGDKLTYSIEIICGTYGSDINTNFCIPTANGLGTITPSIDITKCSDSIISCILPLNLTVSLGKETLCTPIQGTYIYNGTFIMSNTIPSGQCVEILLKNTNQTFNGCSTTQILCKTTANPNYTIAHSFDNSGSQPQCSTITTYNGDSLCYKITLNTLNAGSSANAILCIDDLFGSIGVDPNKVIPLSGSCISLSASQASNPAVVSLCVITSNCECSNGFITITPPLINISQYVSTEFVVNQLSCGTGNIILQFLCKPNGGSSYLNLCCINTVSNITNPIACNTQTAIINMQYGDVVCFINNSTIGGFVDSYSEFYVCSTNSSPDIQSTICSTKYCNRVSVTV